jgi:type III secretion protein T
MLMYAPRVLAAAMLLPLLGPPLVPLPVTSVVALALGAFAAVTAGVSSLPALGPGLLFALTLKEAAIGATIGFSFALVLRLGQTVGQFIDHQTGLTFSQNLDPQFGNQVSVTGQLLDQVILGYIVASGGLLVIAEALLLSYDVWAVFAFAPRFAEAAPPLLLDLTSRLFALALLLTAPVMLVLFLTDLGLGFLGRAAPQLNIFYLSAAVKPWLALLLLLLALSFLLSQSMDALRAIKAALLTLKV